MLNNLPLPFREEIQQLPPLRRQRQGWVESLAGPSEALVGKGPLLKVYNKSFYSILIGRKILRHPPITFFPKNFLQKLVHLPYLQVIYYYASCYFDSGVYMSLGGSYLPDLVCCASEILKLQSFKLRRPEHQ